MRGRRRAFAGVVAAAILAAAASPSVSAAQGSGEEDAALLFALGRLEAQEGDVESARQLLRRAVDLEPDEPYLRLELANLLASVGAWREASRQATAARSLAPDDPDVVRVFARIHLYQVRENPAALDSALEAFEDLRSRTPSDLEALTSLGRIYLGQGRYDEAAEVYEQVLRYWPGHPQAQAALIDSLIRGGHKGRAEEELTELLEATPDDTELRMTLADLLSERGAHQRAVDVLRGADAGSDPQLGRRLAIELYRVGELEEALRYLRDWVASEPDDVRARYLQSLLLSSLGRDEEALAALEDLRQRRPEDVEAATFVARHHLQRGDWRRVEETAEPFVADGVDPGEEELVLQSGQALRALGRSAEALNRLALVASDAELGVRARSVQAEILFDQGRRDEAEALLARLADEGEEGLRLAASVYQRRERYEDSIDVLRRLLAIDPDGVETLFWLGAAYERTQRFAEAEETFLALLEKAPEFAPALNYLGYMWAERGRRLDEALQLVERAVDLEPDNGAYLDSLGWTHFQLGDYEEARGHLERAAEIVGEDATVLEHLGDVYRELGDREGAARAYRRALEAEGAERDRLERKLRRLRRR